MRVLFVSAGDEHITGVYRYDREVTSGLAQMGATVQVFTPEGPRREAGTEDGTAKKDDMSDIGFFLKGVGQSISLHSKDRKRTFRSVLDEFRPDVVHISIETSVLFSPLPKLCHEAGIPVVGTQHQPMQQHATLSGAFSVASYAMMLPFIKDFDRLIVFSEDQKRIMERVGMEPERMVVLPNAVDEKKFSPGPSNFREEIGASCVVLFVGRLSIQKNISLLLDVFVRSKFDPSVKLVVVGGGDQETTLLASYGKCDNVIFTGPIRDENRIIEILRGSDIFALPSRREGLSLALLEAMSVGLACVSTEVGGHRELLEGCGFHLAPTGVKTQLKMALRHLVENPGLRELLGRQARKRIHERYTLRGMISRLLDIYREAGANL